MNRKVFISFLGTNNYLRTHYDINGIVSAPVRFIQEVLTDHLCSDWTDEDKIFIFYTKESKEKNWEDGGQTRFVEDESFERIGLKSTLSCKKYASLVEGIEIKEGFSEDDVWSIFNTVFEKLNCGDKIHFDVTHAFRSIPMFSTILFNYAQFVKGIHLESVYYAAFEKLGPAHEVKNIPLSDRIAPVLDLSSLIRLQQLTEVARDYSVNGRISGIGSMMVGKYNNNQTVVQTISKLQKWTDKLEGLIQTYRITELRQGKFVAEINNFITTLLDKSNLKQAEQALLIKLLERVSQFKEDGGDANIEAAINRAFDYNMLPQAYTMGQEYVISRAVSLLENCNFYTDMPEKEKKIRFREYVSAVLAIKDEDAVSRNYKDKLSHNIDLTDKLLQEEWVIKIRKPYSALASNRNIVNHGKTSDLSIAQFKKLFEKNYYECLKVLEQC